MDKEVFKFLNKESNVLVIDKMFKITREVTEQGMEYYQETFIEDYEGKYKEYDWNSFWKNPSKKKPKDVDNPKNTGGKAPYIILMTDEIEKLREKNIKNVEELIGYVVSIGKNIEWSTGRLVHKRSKKQLQYNDLLDIYKCSRTKLDKMLKLMKDNDLLYNTKDGYFISSKYIKKGKKKGV